MRMGIGISFKTFQNIEGLNAQLRGPLRSSHRPYATSAQQNNFEPLSRNALYASVKFWITARRRRRTHA